MIDLHQEGRAALAAEFAMTESGRGDGFHLVRSTGPFEGTHRNAGKDHAGRSAGQLARAAMAPAGVKRFALQFVADSSARAPAREAHKLPPLHLTTARALLTSR